MKFSKQFFSAKGQLEPVERHLQKDKTLRSRYQEIFDIDVKAGFVRQIDQLELNQTRGKLQWYLPHHLVINLINSIKSEECPTQQQSTKKWHIITNPICQIAVSAANEAIILQNAIPRDASR